MSNKLKVVHLADTPLVGSPGKISKTLNDIGIDSISYCTNDYPDRSALNKKFISDTIIINNCTDHVYKTFLDDIANADIIHIHNSFNMKIFSEIYKSCYHKKFIYQVHSPIKEGPLFYNKAKDFNIEFSQKIVVSQYQPRLYPDYKLVPNLITERPNLRLRERNEKLRVLYSPTHKRAGRWNNKTSILLHKSLQALHSSGIIELTSIDKPVTPKELYRIRVRSDVSIDEISTGGFHQVSLEGLCAGNIVVNRADFLSKMMLASATNSSLPPFFYSTEENILENLTNLSKNIELTNNLKEKSFNYYKKHLTPEVLIKNYVQIYNEGK